MIIMSHRGYWKAETEKNQEIAFNRSFELGYGTETDVRDCGGLLLISHDMPSGSEITLDQFLSIVNNRALPLAVNIKADGLANVLKVAFGKYPDLDWFVFDMSIPDTKAHLNAGNPVFIRMSEVERIPAWVDQARGIWLDGFDSVWYDNALILEMLHRNKRVCIVSEDLHKRNPSKQWEMLSQISSENFMLCTDFPEEATEFFFGEPK
ncbi:phosphodiesterase [Pseudomonas sp. RIT623]|uniref:phosphodiesterase n=1 Tax=Pseudomonas sp. RIT623 TaxID=2559075 RepID=UPI00106FE198|nr:phosphodiesterase [Pseudomonas sp. RIT623]TFF33869.1 phosphodiesterase [Pseudomonas sp. RIT623]